MRNWVINSFLFTVICLLKFGVSSAQLNNSPLRITEENGLSDNNIECIFKDHNDFFWVGTASGLNLLNGSGITTFKNIPGDKTSISGNHITAIAEDASGIIWVGTYHGLNYFDRASEKFSAVRLLDDDPANQESISSIAVSPANQIYVATGFALVVYDPSTKKKSRIILPGKQNSKQNNNHITHLEFSKTGLLYISTFNGLWSYDEQTNHFSQEIREASLFNNFIFDHQGNIWIGTWDKGLIRWNPVTKKDTIYKSATQDYSILALAEVPSPKGSTIITNTVMVENSSSQEMMAPLAAASFGTIQSILYNPADDRVWIGSDQGLYLLRLSENNFKYHTFNHRITTQNVSILEWEHQFLVGGSGPFFLRLYDKNLNEVEDFSPTVPFKSVECLAIKQDGQHSIKCGTSRGLADINPETKRMVFRQLADSTVIQYQLQFINCIFKDSRNTWWVFPWRNGVWTQDSNRAYAKKVFNNFLTSFANPNPS